jgi:ribosomal protein S18 acetylase RimI-like enzyme
VLPASVTVRPLEAKDRKAWEPHWEGYQRFYKVAFTPEVTDTTWKRLMDPAEPMHALGAFDGASMLGIVHYIFHRSTWTIGDYCYLQDLYVDPARRKGGVGRALIEAVYAAATRAGAARVYWLTAQDNAEARALYDKVATFAGFIQYRKVL